jgi:predicted lipid carrier protein YhbT
MNRALIPLKVFLVTVPDRLHTRVLAAAFNHALRGQDITLRFAEVEGKSVLLHIKDLPCRFNFRFERDRLTRNPGSQSDVIISGNLEDFLRLATRIEDPDTLFFTRKLTIEGETETGLHVKNLLDSMEFDPDLHFDTVLPSPLAAVAKRLVHLVQEYIPQMRRDRTI